MRYRKLDLNGDYTFGQSISNFFVDTPAAVAQAIKTRLLLIQGEWFLDITEGTPYSAKILGAGRVGTFSSALRQVILDTQGVLDIVKYSAFYNPTTRNAIVNATINTIYGTIQIGTNL